MASLNQNYLIFFIEVPVCTSFKTKPDLSAALARYHPKLINMKLSTDMLAELISQNSGFPTKLAIVRLGMQECESWVSSNLVQPQQAYRQRL